MESVNLKALTKTEIFAGATEEEVSSMLNCLSAKKTNTRKMRSSFMRGYCLIDRCYVKRKCPD